MPGGRCRRWEDPFGPPERGLRAVSEIDFSPDGKRIVHHPPTEGDPLFVTEADQNVGRQIFVGRPGFHNHFPLWSHDGAFIYFVHGQALDGQVLDRSDVWRIGPTGGTPEQLTFHNSRVTFPTLLDNRTLLYLATDEEESARGSTRWTSAVVFPTASSQASTSTGRWRPVRMVDGSSRPYHARRSACGACRLPTA